MSAIAGIDLGTTYSALAALNEIGKPEIVTDLNGNRITPSVIAFDGDSTAVVGVEAKNLLSSDPTNVVQFVKRKMKDPSHRYRVGSEEYSPVEISALILKKLKEECVDLGEIKDVVITVPAHFNEIERKSTMDAGNLAGLNVLGVINEPTAAAIYYATQCTLNGKVVVYDLGGGTFDVSVLEINGDRIEILSSKGDGDLGGVDFDNALTRFFTKQACDTAGRELIPDTYFENHPTESNDESKIYFRIMETAEKLKKQLSAREQTRKLMTTHLGDRLRFSATRADFEEMISPFLVTTEMLLENALEDAGLSAPNIDKVILVGGSTRIPKISELLEEFFGFPPEKSINPDEAVALGAAIMAGKKAMQNGSGGLSASMKAEVNKTSVLECTNKYFGTFSISQNVARGQMMRQNTVIIKRGTKLPCQETGNFATVFDGQERITVEVTEAEESTTDPSQVHVLGSYELKLPPNCPAHSEVNITYGYDENQRLQVTVELPDGSIFEGELHYDDEGNLNQSEIKKAAAKVEAFVVE